MKDIIRIATRNSPLALWQANFVKNLLLEKHDYLQVEIVSMTTKGDQLLDSPLSKIGGKGLFIKELESAMLENRADIAVHSMKDVGIHFPEGLGIGAILERHNPYDAFVSNKYKKLDDMPDGAIVGTCSLRRVCQLKNRYPNLLFKDLRGNVNTRLSKLDNNEYDAIILAVAGLERLGMNDRIASIISPEISLPAIAQGAMGIECRIDDVVIMEILADIDDKETSLSVNCERAVNEVLNGSCQTPIAAFAKISGETMQLQALIGEPDGSKMLYADVAGPIIDSRLLGIEAANHLIKQGALDILAKLSTDN